jgi:hypothetical protein
MILHAADPGPGLRIDQSLDDVAKAAIAVAAYSTPSSSSATPEGSIALYQRLRPIRSTSSSVISFTGRRNNVVTACKRVRQRRKVDADRSLLMLWTIHRALPRVAVQPFGLDRRQHAADVLVIDQRRLRGIDELAFREMRGLAEPIFGSDHPGMSEG